MTTVIVLLGILKETLVQRRWQSYDNNDDTNTKKDKTTVFIMCLQAGLAIAGNYLYCVTKTLLGGQMWSFKGVFCVKLRVAGAKTCFITFFP